LVSSLSPHVPNMVLAKMNNYEHQSKPTYASYTFQVLMSFWHDINSSLTIIKAYANCSGRDLNIQIFLIIVQNKTDVHLFVKKRISKLDY